MLRVFPESAEVVDGRLVLGGVPTPDLAARFGTPLRVAPGEDKEAFLERARAAVKALGKAR